MDILSKVDMILFQWLYGHTLNRDCRVIRWISHSGDGHLYLLLGMTLWSFEPKHGGIFLYTALMAYALELPLYIVLKKTIQRQRPCDLFKNLNAHITPSDKFSLPSGHTAAAFLMACLLSHFYPSLAIPVYLWASLIGLSRILLGVHYPGDVVAGGALGLTISNLSLFMLL